jgi:hypothetical protein
MSINKAQISRTLVINSPAHLWTLLKNKEEFYYPKPNINMFMYIVNNIWNCFYYVLRNTDTPMQKTCRTSTMHFP